MSFVMSCVWFARAVYVPLATSGRAGVEVLVIGIADDTLRRREYGYRTEQKLGSRDTMEGRLTLQSQRGRGVRGRQHL